MKNIVEYKADRKRYPSRAVQFGEGNFLRAFVGEMLCKIGVGVDIVQPLPNGMSDAINAQEGLYTLILRGIDNNELKEEKRIIENVNSCVNPYADYDKFISLAKNPELRFMFSNTTEAGIAFDNSCKFEDKPAKSFPGKATQFLFERFKFFNGDKTKGILVIPCELIDYNGRQLKKCIIEYIDLWNLGEDFKAWIENSCTFASSLVDRIVTGYPKDMVLEYEDKLIDTGEYFHLWVIEGLGTAASELPFDKAGLNVIFTDDIRPYKTRKVCILNGAHTMTVLAAYMAGYETVLDLMGNDIIKGYMKKGIFDEIIPTIPMDKDQLKSYANSVLERFSNPYLQHKCIDIALNSLAKFKERVLPSLLKYNEMFGKLPEVLTLSLSALITFYKGDSARDSIENIDYMKSAGVSDILSNTSLWGKDLCSIDGLYDKVNNYINEISEIGILKVMEKVING